MSKANLKLICWFLFGPGPVLCCFAVLLFGETQIWLGDLRVVVGCVFWFVCFLCYDDLPAVLDHTSPFSRCFSPLTLL